MSSCWLVTVAVVVLSLCVRNEANIYFRFERMANALNCLLDFVTADLHNMNVDGVFGIVIAQAQLEMLLDVQLPRYERNIIAKLANKCQRITLTPQPDPYNSEMYNKVVNNLMQPSMWKINNSYDNTLPNLLPYDWTLEDVARNAFFGQPNEKTSDRCLGELIDSSLFNNRSCTTSKFCSYIMNDLDESYGYPLAHKLLYAQMMRGLNCELEGITFALKTRYLCTRMLKEARTIELRGFPIFVKDLFLEQIVLCGIEGFEQFLSSQWQDMILNFQTENCCYRFAEAPRADGRWRLKRDTSIMSYQCDSHFTGLAAAALATNLRYMLFNN